MKTSKSYHYRVVDVFTSQPLEGNPLAVFPDAAGLSSELMQKIPRELNLSETVFLFPPTRSECAARLRIFTPGREMDFAGHPTVGSAYVLLDEGVVSKGTTRFVVEENVGPIPINVDSTDDDKDSRASPKIWLTTPPIRERGMVAAALAADVLGLKESQLLKIAPQILDAGNPTLLVPIADRATVDHISFDTSAWKRLKLDHPGPLCIFAFAPVAEGA
jgi:trans-2,3-dihydro-3-hydroxyanthranilate isomerase